MRWLGCVASGILLASAACDKKDDAGSAGAAGSAASATATVPDASAVSAGGTDAGGEARPKSAFPMPEQPVTLPQTMVGSGMPVETQQKAIGYMAAMRAPHPDDAPADPAYAKDLVEKLKPISLAMDNGAEKGRMNRVEMVASGRQIDILMAAGCDEKTPVRAVATRASVPLAALVSHGVLVIRCNDMRIQCLQSTRDPDDVLCTTAPRHK